MELTNKDISLLLTIADKGYLGGSREDLLPDLIRQELVEKTDRGTFELTEKGNSIVRTIRHRANLNFKVRITLKDGTRIDTDYIDFENRVDDKYAMYVYKMPVGSGQKVGSFLKSDILNIKVVQFLTPEEIANNEEMREIVDIIGKGMPEVSLEKQSYGKIILPEPYVDGTGTSLFKELGDMLNPGGENARLKKFTDK
jgi:hypothetical protein